MLEDPVRNGYLMCLIGSKLYGEPLDGVFVYPATIRECKKNMANAFTIFRNYSDDYPYELLYKEEEILKGCPNTTWQFMEAMMQAWKEQYQDDPRLQDYASFEQNKVLGMNLLSEKEQADNKKTYSMGVPYTAKQINLLKDSITLWLVGLGVFQNNNPHALKNSKSY